MVPYSDVTRGTYLDGALAWRGQLNCAVDLCRQTGTNNSGLNIIRESARVRVLM